MTIVCNGSREWPPYSNNRQDTAYSERREEVLRRLRLSLTPHDLISYSNNRQDAAYSEGCEEVLGRLRLLLTPRDIPYTNQKTQNFEFLRSNSTFGDFL